MILIRHFSSFPMQHRFIHLYDGQISQREYIVLASGVSTKCDVFARLHLMEKCLSWLIKSHRMVQFDPFKSQTHTKRLEIKGMVSQSCLIGVTLRKRLPLRFPHEVVHLKHTHAHTHTPIKYWLSSILDTVSTDASPVQRMLWAPTAPMHAWRSISLVQASSHRWFFPNGTAADRWEGLCLP